MGYFRERRREEELSAPFGRFVGPGSQSADPYDIRRSMELTESLDTAHDLGGVLSLPSAHFSRIFALLDARERKKLLVDAFQAFREIDPDISNEREFVASVLYPTWEENPSIRLTLGEQERVNAVLSPKDRRELAGTLSRKTVDEFGEPRDCHADRNKRIEGILTGTDHWALAVVLSRTTLGAQFDSPALAIGIRELFARALGKQILTPQQAAALASCVHQNQLRLRAFEIDAEIALSDAHTYARHNAAITSKARDLEDALPDLLKRHSVVMEQQESVVKPFELCARFQLQATPAGILVPVRSRLVIARNMREALIAAERDLSSVMAMTPREFEEFMAEVFRGLGYSVELTLPTRDGGADLLCLKQEHGIPFRLAVELKRYKQDHRVSVALVRSFVGANKKFRANRLLFVTTSDYTSSAMEYANQFASHELTLKKYDQIQEWCRDCLTLQPRIIGPSANLLP